MLIFLDCVILQGVLSPSLHRRTQWPPYLFWPLSKMEDCSAGVWIANANHNAILLWIHHFTACLCWISNLLLHSAVRAWLLSLDVHAELLLLTLNGDIVQPDSMRYVWNSNVERLPKEHYTSGKKININEYKCGVSSVIRIVKFILDIFCRWMLEQCNRDGTYLDCTAPTA